MTPLPFDFAFKSQTSLQLWMSSRQSFVELPVSDSIKPTARNAEERSAPVQEQQERQRIAILQIRGLTISKIRIVLQRSPSWTLLLFLCYLDDEQKTTRVARE